MPKFVIENPKMFAVAIAGITVFVLERFVFKETLPPELRSYFDIISLSVTLGLIGRFSRLTKSEAALLKEYKVTTKKPQKEGNASEDLSSEDSSTESS